MPTPYGFLARDIIRRTTVPVTKAEGLPGSEKAGLPSGAGTVNNPILLGGTAVRATPKTQWPMIAVALGVVAAIWLWARSH